MWCAAWFDGGSPESTAFRHLNLRYALASWLLLVLQARGLLKDAEDVVEAGLHEMVEHGVLEQHEAEVLAPLPSKAQVVWAWLTTGESRPLTAGRPQPLCPCVLRPSHCLPQRGPEPSLRTRCPRSSSGGL